MIENIIEKKNKLQLNVEGLTKTFGGQIVLDNINLDLHEGEVVLLLGANASGKTTLLNILSGNLKPDSGNIKFYTNSVEECFSFPRNYMIDLNPFDHFSPERLSFEGVSRTWQEIRLFKTQSLSNNIAVASKNQAGENPINVLLSPIKVRKQEKENRINSDALLEKLKLNGRSSSSGDKISLGQAKRIEIARALQTGAKILFLDEPLSGLDSKGIEESLSLLNEISRNHNVTIVIIEHVFNLRKISHLTDTIWYLEGGKLKVEKGSDKDRRLLELNRSAEEFQRIFLFQGREIERIKLAENAFLRIMNSDLNDTDNIIFEVRDLVVYRDNRLVIGSKRSDDSAEGISFKLKEGQKIILEAPNGWGKSTLLDALTGIIPAKSGVIKFKGKPIESLPVWKRAELGIRYLKSRSDGFSGLTVRENFTLNGVREIPKKLAYLANRRISSLSGGEKQKVFLELIYKNQGDVNFFDEPLSALDQQGINDFLNNFIKKGKINFLAIPTN